MTQMSTARFCQKEQEKIDPQEPPLYDRRLRRKSRMVIE